MVFASFNNPFIKVSFSSSVFLVLIMLLCIIIIENKD